MISFYYAIDGDDIGKKLEEYALKNDISSILLLSENVKLALKEIKNHFESNGGVIVFCEGDSLLASSEKQVELPIDLLFHNTISFSAGVGKTTAMALLALKKAKGLGKKRVEIFMGELV
ncbi:MAG: mCpol domain-containing protein [Candidatus Electrothrix sp. ATG2]|nr:mCpol domain-containing protein [Candidatus Electrothrix sp. ATG2]